MFTERLPLGKREIIANCILPLPVGSEDWVIAFHIYADASGKLRSRDDYTSFCGFVGTVSEWSTVTQEWHSCRLKWLVPPIHMAKIMHPERDAEWLKVKTRWADQWETNKNAMLESFASIIRRSDVVCIGAVVDATHFKKIAASDPLFNDTFKDTMYLALYKLITEGIIKTEVIDRDPSLSLVIDDDPEYSIECYKLLQAMKDHDAKVKERIHAIAFVNDDVFPGVQAADVIAYEARRLMVEEVRTKADVPPSELFKSLTLGLIHQPLHFTAKELDEMQTDLHAKAAQNQKGSKP